MAAISSEPYQDNLRLARQLRWSARVLVPTDEVGRSTTQSSWLDCTRTDFWSSRFICCLALSCFYFGRAGDARADIIFQVKGAVISLCCFIAPRPQVLRNKAISMPRLHFKGFPQNIFVVRLLIVSWHPNTCSPASRTAISSCLLAGSAGR